MWRGRRGEDAVCPVTLTYICQLAFLLGDVVFKLMYCGKRDLLRLADILGELVSICRNL